MVERKNMSQWSRDFKRRIKVVGSDYKVVSGHIAFEECFGREDCVQRIAGDDSVELGREKLGMEN